MAWIHLAPEIDQWLDGLVVRTSRRSAYYVHEFIVNGLDDLEDFYLANATTAFKIQAVECCHAYINSFVVAALGAGGV